MTVQRLYEDMIDDEFVCCLLVLLLDLSHNLTHI